MPMSLSADQITDPNNAKVVVIGPNRVRNLNSILGDYSGSEKSYSWPTTGKVDLYNVGAVEVFATSAQAEYYSGLGAIRDPVTIDANINLADTKYRNTINPRHSALYDRDCQPGDIVTVYNGANSFTTTVQSLDGDLSPSEVSAASPSPNNTPLILADAVSWTRTGPSNGVDIAAVDISNYAGAEYGAVETTYVIRIVRGGHPTQARLRVYNTHGDNVPEMQIANWNLPTPIGTRGLQVSFRSPWANSNHPYRRKITVQTDNIDEDLDDFPVQVVIPYSIHGGKIQYVFNADEDRVVPNIFFYDSNGQAVPYDFEGMWSLGGNQYIYFFWVRMSLKKNPVGNDNTVWVYYGGNTRQTPQPATVFASYDFVTHMWEAADGSRVISSKGPGGTKTETDAPVAYYENGRLGQRFNESIEDYVDFTNTIGGYTTENFTIEVWAKVGDRDSGTGEHIVGRSRVFGIYDPEDPLGGWFFHVERYWNGVPRRIWFYFREQGKPYANYVNSVENIIQTGTWYHLAVVRNGTNIRLYIDGIDRTAVQYQAVSDLAVPTARKCFAGYDPVNVAPFRGSIDEIRFSPIQRSPAWLKFEHANVTQPDNELSWGNEETMEEFEEQAGFLLGQMWWINIQKAFTPPTAISGGTYQGTRTRRYTITVTKGGENPEIQYDSLDDSGGSLPVVVNTPIPIGQSGVTVKFDRLPLCKGDKYFITAYPPEVRTKHLIRLANPVPWGAIDQLSLRIPGTYKLEDKDFFAYTDGVILKANIHVTHPTFTNGSTLVPIPLKHAIITADYYTINNQSSTITRCTTQNNITQIPGDVSPDNPLKHAVYTAFLHAGGNPVYFIGVNEPENPNSWLQALSQLEQLGDLSLASIIPTTNNPEILDELFEEIHTNNSHAYRTLWLTCTKTLPYYVLTGISVTISQTAPGVYSTITAQGSAPFLSVKAGDKVLINVDSGVYIDTVIAVVNSMTIRTQHGYRRAVLTPVSCNILRILSNPSDILAAYTSLATRYSSEKVRLVYTDNLTWFNQSSHYALPSALAGLRSSIYPQVALSGPLYGFTVDSSINILPYYNLGLITTKLIDNNAWVYKAVVPVMENNTPKDETPINIGHYVYRRVWSTVTQHLGSFENWSSDPSLYMKAVLEIELGNMVENVHPKYGRLITGYSIDNIAYSNGEFMIDLTVNIPKLFKSLYLTLNTRG